MATTRASPVPAAAPNIADDTIVSLIDSRWNSCCVRAENEMMTDECIMQKNNRSIRFDHLSQLCALFSRPVFFTLIAQIINRLDDIVSPTNREK